MLTIEQFEQYVARLPKAAHNMEHITNFGRIVAKGFVLIASEIQRGNQRLIHTLAGGSSRDFVDPEALAARAAAERKAKRERLERELAELGAEPEALA
jgi:hypothetical protein